MTEYFRPAVGKIVFGPHSFPPSIVSIPRQINAADRQLIADAVYEYLTEAPNRPYAVSADRGTGYVQVDGPLYCAELAKAIADKLAQAPR